MADVKDISFKNERLGYKFNYRVAALIFNKDKVLLQKAEDNDSYFLLGGRVQFGEDTTEAIKREVYEETGVTIDDNSYKLLDKFTIVSADYQSKGKGRNDRVWESSKGLNLMFSILIKDPKLLEVSTILSLMRSNPMGSPRLVTSSQSVCLTLNPIYRFLD